MNVRLFATATLLSAASMLPAQTYKQLVTVSEFRVPPSQVEAFVEKGKAFVPALDKLVDSGVILAYGIDTDLLHVPGSNNVTFWTVVPNYEALSKAEEAIGAVEKKDPSLMPALIAMSDPATHHDFIIRSREEGHRAVPAGSHPFTDIDAVRVKPGRMGDFSELFRKYDKPVFDKLVADGVIYGYELDTEAVHTMEPGMTWTVVTMPDLGTKDKVDAAFTEAEKKIPDAERDLTEKIYNDIVVAGSHRDSLSVSPVYRQK
jgi:hypothetical protein